MRSFKLAMLWLAAGCSGIIGAPGGNGTEGGETAALCASATPKPTSPGTKLVRLTHAQYDNTIRDLLGVTVTPSSTFQKDSTFSGFNNSAVGLQIADRLGRDYRRAAEELSAQVASAPASIAKISPCAANTDVCARQFIAAFGKRAFRRPLTESEGATYFTLFKAANTLLDGTDSFAKGVQLTLEAMLQSPNFLYRVELAETAPQDNMVALSSYEVAARLSYLLWGSMPDDALLELADSGELLKAETIKAQTTRLLDDARAQSVIDDFHAQWLDLARDNNLVRDTTMYPNFNATTMGPMMQQETLRFLRHIIFEARAPFSTVYTAPYSFVNRDLAAIYKLEGTFSSTEFTKVALDPTQRRGLLTQTGFLASHAFARNDSPIHRGVFVIRRVLGLPQGDPPPGIDFTLPPVGSGAIKTTRQQVASKTSPAGCASCHDRINAFGFAFGNYDAIGQHRTQENGEPIDATGAIALETNFSFTNALELSTQVSKSNEARIAYAANWVRYAYQRPEASEDFCDITTMAANLGAESYPVRDMIAGLTATTTFRFRPVELTP